MMRMFNEALAEFDTDKINQAFTEWAKKSSVMPTPADIIKIIESKQVYQRPEYHVFSTTPEEKEYIRSTKKIVPWANKQWGAMGIDLQNQCIAHTRQLAEKQGKEKAIGYLQYLHSHCGAPKDLKQQIFG